MRRLAAALVAACVVSGAGACSNGDDRTDTAPTDPATTTGAAPATTVAPVASESRGPRGSGRTVTFAFGGDVHFVDHIAVQLEADPDQVLAPIAPVLSGADLAMVNLETAITERGEPVAGKNFHFRSPARSFAALQAAGVDVVNMANNHVLDYGPVGLQDTFDAIARSKLPVVGLGHDAAEAYGAYRTTIKGQRIGIVSANEWLEPALVPAWQATESQPGIAFSTDRTRLLDAVRGLRPEVDTLVAFLHWGTEETYCASPEQQDLARTLLAAGADLVVGSHAHRVFGAGRVGTSLVAYGLGNFVYWREDGESGRSGVLLVEATGREVGAYSWVPARITNGIPVPETGAAATASVAEWERRRTCSGLAP